MQRLRAPGSACLPLFLFGLCILIAPGAQGQAVFGPPLPPRVALPLPAVRVTLSRSIYRITVDPKTGAPQMPSDVVATASLLNVVAAPIPSQFVWHAYLRWDYKPFPTSHEIEKQTFIQPSPLRLNLAGQIRGGTLTVFARTVVNGRPVLGRAQAIVVADNPSRAAVLRLFPANRTGLIASKIGMAESGLHQFTVAKGPDCGGQPYVSASQDIGLMQLNSTSGGVDQGDEVWDWRANVRRGLAMLEGKRRATLASRSSSGSLRSRPVVYTFEGRTGLAAVNVCRIIGGLDWLPLPDSPPISDSPGSGMLAGEIDPDHLKLTQREREAIRRYNGGSEYACDLAMDPGCLSVHVVGLVPDPTRGGIGLRRGDPNYVDHVLAARSGFTLPAPPKPPRRLPLRHSHRRRRA